MSPTVYVGANRGIGFHLVQELSIRSDVVIYAGIRSFPPAPDSQLGKLAAALPSVVIPIKITSGDEEDNKAAAESVKAQVGHVHVLIANAGGATQTGPITVEAVPPSLLHADFELNAVGPVVLYQAYRPLLVAAGSAKFVAISSMAGQISEGVPIPVASYGAAKAALNFLSKKIDQESPEIVAFPIHPGLVVTDGSKAFMTSLGIEDLSVVGAITPEECVKGLMAVVDQATKETHGGKFWTAKGEQVAF